MNCPKCKQTIGLLAKNIQVYGIDANLKALYCGNCLTIITVIPVNRKESKKKQQPNMYFI